MNMKTARDYNIPLFQTAWFKMLLIQNSPEKVAERIAEEIQIGSQFSVELLEYFGENFNTITYEKFLVICDKIYNKTF